MKKEIRTVKKEKGVVQITTVDERWYVRDSVNPITGLPEYQFVPSVTWVAGHYPKGISFYKWLADKGWDEAEAIKQAAGDKGSKIHLAIADLIAGQELRMDAKYMNKSTGQEEELTPDEWEAIMSFVDWYNEEKPAILGSEFVVWGGGYAGTIDILYRKQDGRLSLLDLKSGQCVWPEYELQVSAYAEALRGTPIDGMILGEPIMLEILQVGYKRNKIKKYKLTEIENKFALFLAAKQIWANETAGVVPLQKDYPLSLTLNPTHDTQPPAGAPKAETKVRKTYARNQIPKSVAQAA